MASGIGVIKSFNPGKNRFRVGLSFACIQGIERITLPNDIFSGSIFTGKVKYKNKKKPFFLNRLKYKHHPLLFRRLAFFWVFLIFLEIGCPLFECQIFAEKAPIENQAISISQASTDNQASPETLTKEDPKFRENSVASDDYQSQPEDCNDECLCHITPVNVLAFTMPKDFSPSSASPVNIEFQLSGDLPPPYHPPQFI